MSRQPQTNGNLALDQKKVIIIEAAPKAEAAKLRVAAYCRVSSDSTDQLNSFMAQLNYYNTLIASKENWTLVDLYADEGISGTSAEKRPDFQRLLSDCRRGRVDKVLVKSVSRFARNTRDCLETVRELKSIGVGVCFEEQHIDTSNMSGELLTAVFAAMSQKESENISAHMRWSYQVRMKGGTFLPSAVPFGYVIQDKKIVVNEEQAGVVRAIFHRYLAGQSMDEIAAWLNWEDIPVRLGIKSRKWIRSAVSYILSNERYIGDSLWQKTYATDTLPARQVRNHGEREQYYAEGTHPPIIDKETFLAAQALKSRRIEKRGAVQRQRFPLHGMIVCGVCGTIYRRKVWNGKTFWVCRSHDRGLDNCPSGRIPEEEIHTAFLRVYHKLRLHGEPILKQMITDLQSIRERRMLWSMGIVELNKRIADLSDQDRMLADMNKCGLVDPDVFISQSNELARQIRAAKQEKERLLADGGDDVIPKTQELMETLDTLPEFLPAFDNEIFTDLVDRITAEENGALRFRLKNGLELTETTERSVR